MFVRKLVGKVDEHGMQRVELHDYLFSKLIGKDSKLPALKTQRVGSKTFREFEYNGIHIFSMYSYNEGSAFLMKFNEAQERLSLLDKSSNIVFGVDFSGIAFEPKGAI